ncbi:MAG: hypothetical protein HYS55_03655 [Candidatus Omnitrophica bacterium]|nr:hypothetical protein [Candidatus Omnitrophota bacterium]
MKTEKKLKRGLADLSHLFGERQRRLVIEPPEEFPLEAAPPNLISTAFFSGSHLLTPQELFQFVEPLRNAFHEVVLLALSPNRDRYQFLEQAFQIPPWEEITSRAEFCLHSLGERFAFGFVSPTQFQKMIHPKWTDEMLVDSDGSRKGIVVFDSLDTKMNFSQNTPVLDLIDHCIFILKPEASELISTYELMHFYLAKSQHLRTSILFVGNGAHELAEYAYEEFNGIASRFLGYDLGFLGWLEKDQAQINAELLLEETGSIFQMPLKAALKEMLYPPLVKV